MYKQQNGLYKLYKENDLMELLKLKRAEYFNTKKALIDNGLIKIDTDKNITSLKNKLLKIKVNNQHAIMYMERDGMKAFVVNPSIYYKGNNINDLNYLIDLFRI